MKGICTVVLAAGSSRRLGFNKLLVRIDGQTVIRRSVAPFLTDGIEKVYVVAGGSGEELREELKGVGPLEVVENPFHLQGMSSSVKAVLPRLEGIDGVFFHLGDKPFVESRQVRLMLDRYRREGGAILIPRYEGKKGHPVLMNPRPYLEEMRGLTGDKGLREVIEKHIDDVVFLDGDEGNLFDIDTAEEIDILRRRGHKIEES